MRVQVYRNVIKYLDNNISAHFKKIYDTEDEFACFEQKEFRARVMHQLIMFDKPLFYFD